MIVVKIYNQFKHLKMEEQVRHGRYTKEYYLAFKKEGNTVICDNIDEPGENELCLMVCV
jgi:hypothetical protein